MKTIDFGLKNNWSYFIDFAEKELGNSSFPTLYFVYEEDDCGDEVHIFDDHSDLDKWLAEEFWRRERYDTNNMEESMDDFFIWKVVSESDFKRLSNLYEGAKLTPISVNGERYYRKKIAVAVEPTVNVSTNFY
ncbi:hypothetical protein [Terribacillus sp. AE2B 122]|uniref:hypothetical protein n=1 Tax=Terribacillus sp. AE2B 122 TaxID=1331902 RepID=UPI0014409726|nr:hypothetical protein [Terribacillus sp. AE2B 122]VVM35095.1 hypothetical protein [Terribacillus sp. AE2B 122]